MRELLCKDDDYIRVEVRNFGVIESKPAKAKPKQETPELMKKFLYLHIKKHILNQENF